MNKKVIIIGGVAGGATTGARLRRLHEDLDIILIERGGYISYANCGLPYYIGDVIKERDALLLQTPEIMRERFNIDVRIESEALSINRETKRVTIKNLISGEEYDESYDFLVIATGSSPIKPPIPGIDGPNIHTLWTIPDTDRIKDFVVKTKPKTAAVIGGGFIGLEMAENLHAAGCQVSLIEMQNQVMAPLDFEMAQLIHENLRMNGIHLLLNDGVSSFSYENGNTKIALQSGKGVEAELVILSLGIKPNSQLAKDSGLTLNAKGGIAVDETLKTSDPFIYAVGDVIEVKDLITKAATMVPLAGPANKQGRICANNIAKELTADVDSLETYQGTQGTSIAQIFDLTAASTGLNEKKLTQMGQTPNKDYYVALINQKSHAGYYPGASPLTLKLLFTPEGILLGSQIIGQEGVDKRIDIIASTLRLHGTIYDLKELELAYAPPFSSAKDPVNMAGFVAENIIKGISRFSAWNELEPTPDQVSDDLIVLDVTEPFERMAFQIPGSYHIPLGQLRMRLNELPREKKIIVYCAIGVRSYNGARILMNNGFKNVTVYPGGSSFYKSIYHESFMDAAEEEKVEEKKGKEHPPRKEKGSEEPIEVSVTKVLDCSGLQCPGPIMRIFNTINEIEEGQVIQVAATDMGFARDISAWCKRTGNTLLKSERKDKQNIVYIKKGAGANSSCQSRPSSKGDPEGSEGITEIDQSSLTCELTAPVQPQGKTMVVFSGDLDKVLASLIIANGAAAMGSSVTMFFTFWGLNALRKSQKQPIKKPFMDRMFSAMMPRGTSKLKLSQMNMGGMGTAMMKKVMKDKNVDSVEMLMEQAIKNGVKLVACTMSMDVMGITKEELIEGVTLAGVASYLGDAEQSNVNLFI